MREAIERHLSLSDRREVTAMYIVYAKGVCCGVRCGTPYGNVDCGTTLSAVRLVCMGLLNAVMSYGKARMLGNILRRGLGGKVSTGLMVTYLAKKAFDYYRTKKAIRTH